VGFASKVRFESNLSEVNQKSRRVTAQQITTTSMSAFGAFLFSILFNIEQIHYEFKGYPLTAHDLKENRK
jgi:hypothetical protein